MILEGFLIPATSYIKILSLRTPLLDKPMQTAFTHTDAILLPVSPSTALDGLEIDDDIAKGRHENPPGSGL